MTTNQTFASLRPCLPTGRFACVN